MRPFVRFAAAALVVALSLPAGSSALGAPRQAPGGAPSVPSPNDAIDDLVSCVQGSNRLLVTFLIDESGSLKDNDPKNRRVDVAENALDQLVGLAEGSGGGAPVPVDVTFAAFSNQYQPVRDWTTIGSDTRDDLRASLEKFRIRNKGIDTDFDLALSGARNALTQRGAEVAAGSSAPAPCKTILLFTDGGFYIAPRTKANQEQLGLTKPYAPDVQLTTEAGRGKAIQAGIDDLCRVGGVADQIRNGDITLLTVALAGTLDAAAQRPLAAATAGRADDFTCGTPTDRAPGAYLPASGADVLISRFDEVATRVAGGTPVEGTTEVTTCGDKTCDEGARSFKLDQGVRRAHLLAVPPSGAAAVILEGPENGLTRVERPGPFTVGGVSGRATAVAGGALSIDLDRPKAKDGGWDGTWTATLTGEGTSVGKRGTLSVYVFSDLGIEIGKTAGFVRGQTATVTADLVAPKGVVPASLLTQAAATVRFVDPVSGSNVDGFDQIALTGTPGGPFTGTVAIPADTTISAVEATVALRATTTGGAVITSQSATTSVQVLRPKGSVQFAPALLALPSADGTDATSTTLLLLGGDKPGCVWIGRTQVPTAPEGAAPVGLTLDGRDKVTKASCIKVPAKGHVEVEVEASAAGRSVGTVRGTLELFEQVDGAPVASTTLVPFRFDLTRGVDQVRRLALALGLAAGGILLPMLLLYLVNAATARFQRFDAVLGAALPVVVEDGVVLQPSGSRLVPLAFTRSDFGPLTHAKSKRRFEFGGVRFRARAARNPFAAVVATAAPAGGAEKLKGGAGSKVELDPGLAGSWVFLLDPDATRASARNVAKGQVLVFVADGELDVQAARMVPDIESRLPRTAATLALAVRKVAPKVMSKRQRRAAEEAATPDDDVVVDSEAAIDVPLASRPARVDAAAPVDEGDPKSPGEEPPAPAVEDRLSAPPVGFGGVAAAPSQPPAPAEDTKPDDDSGPPLGFGGAPRP